MLLEGIWDQSPKIFGTRTFRGWSEVFLADPAHRNQLSSRRLCRNLRVSKHSGALIHRPPIVGLLYNIKDT